MQPAPSLSTNSAGLALARQHLLAYTIATNPKYRVARHHRVIAAALQRVVEGKTKRLMIFAPPRHGKSELASVRFPAYYLGHHPDRFIIAASFAQDLADDFGRQVRNQIADPLYGQIFPGVGLRADSQAAARFHTSEGGVYFGVGFGGPVNGRGAHLLLLDDLVKSREDSDSAANKKSRISWFQSTAYTRLINEESGFEGAIVLTITRWSDDDIDGWALDELRHEGWEIVRLPAICDEENDPAGRSIGEALWPERYNLEKLARIRQTIGSREWLSLYQQTPKAAEGSLFKREWWRYYNPKAKPQFIRLIQSWDTAFKDGADNDRSAFTCWGVTNSGIYLLDAWAGRMQYPDLKREVIARAKKWNCSEVLIEDKASGQSLIQELRRSTGLAVVAINPGAVKKENRWLAATPLVEAGRVHLPDGEPWLADYLDEMSSVGGGAKHDDYADSSTQAINHIGKSYVFGDAADYSLMDIYS